MFVWGIIDSEFEAVYVQRTRRYANCHNSIVSIRSIEPHQQTMNVEQKDNLCRKKKKPVQDICTYV